MAQYRGGEDFPLREATDDHGHRIFFHVPIHTGSIPGVWLHEDLTTLEESGCQLVEAKSAEDPS
jgi:hypothetical protein